MLVIAAAMPPEAQRLARGLAAARGPARLVVSGIGPDAARSAAEKCLASGGVRAVLGAGVAGGLDPSLPCPSVVLAERLEGDAVDVPLRTSAAAALEAAGIPCRGGDSITTDRVLSDPESKRAAREAGHCIVQMEDRAWLRACREAGVPFASLRVVMDEVGDELPQEVVGWGGRPPPLKLAADIARRPSLGPELLRLARRLRASAQMLETAAAAVIPVLSEPS